MSADNCLYLGKVGIVEIKPRIHLQISQYVSSPIALKYLNHQDLLGIHLYVDLVSQLSRQDFA